MKQAPFKESMDVRALRISQLETVKRRRRIRMIPRRAKG
jgi:hypothetical protein